MDLGLSGLASGLDWRSLVDQLSEVERLPQRRLLSEQSAIEQRNNAYGSIITQLSTLKNRVATLKEASLYRGRTASSADTTVATASAANGATQGSYTFAFSQLATVARYQGATGAGKPISATSNVSSVTLATAGFATAVTAGSFRVNGAEVTVATTDTLQAVFDKIATATNNTVTASYDPTSDKIQLSGSGAITLGSATDTSNFLKVAQLYNNGTSTVASTAALGSARQSALVGEANLSETLTFGTSGTGKFKINGVEIEYTAADKLSDVVNRISNSSAGVTASYDHVNDRFTLTNKETGDVGMALEDVSGNFLAATRLSSGSLSRGKDLLYTIDGGAQLRSTSNTVTSASSGIEGLSVVALKEGGSVKVTVAADTEKVKAAITGFLEEYNRVQSLIANQTASTTDADGKVTTKTLTSESDAESIASTLRRMAYGSVQGLSGTLSHLEALGIKSNSDDDKLELSDTEKLAEVLAENMDDVEELWTDTDSGLAVKFDAYLERMAGEEGQLVQKQDMLTQQASDIDEQIAGLERIVQANRSRMIDSFVAMEKAQASINQQLQYLSRFSSST
ncbi:MAG: flagellar filament capping protein FliD [Verrucomicrobiales bacterium]|nr:flagellar filament capping protein FliD [Verrucomicrobiales bacterium]